MDRTVEAEWLDELPADDPGALGSRRDLKRLNWLMGNTGVLCNTLATAKDCQMPKRIVELGAGDGTFLLGVAKHFAPRWPGVEATLVDCKDAVAEKTRSDFAALGWNVRSATMDVFDWLRMSNGAPADTMIANLFLHQFSMRDLAELLQLIARRTNLFAACEPRRAKIPFALSRMVGFIGCNTVTQHDAPKSVRAGFTGSEISELWPKKSGWRLQERNANIFSHIFLAERIDKF